MRFQAHVTRKNSEVFLSQFQVCELYEECRGKTMIEAFAMLVLCGVVPLAVFIGGYLWDELKETEP